MIAFKFQYLGFVSSFYCNCVIHAANLHQGVQI